jgi:hypothetical protein
MSLTPQQKAVAADWRNRMAEVAAMFGLGATLPPPVGKICGALTAGSGACASLANRYANDPPDPDFRTAVIRSPPIVPSALMKQELGADETLIAFSNALNDSYSHTSAALRAYERAEGASIRGDASALQQRLTEAREHARAGAEDVVRLADTSDRFAARFSDVISSDLAGSAPPPRASSELPDATLAFLYRGGVTLATLTRALTAAAEWFQRDQVELTGEPLRELAVASREFADVLAGWEPAVERRPG